MDRERIGKYTIVGELGRGTMGEVYKAHDPVLNRFVALKTLPARLGPDNETLQRFQREAQAAALLNHPNIVTVHDFGEEQGLLYMAMELLEGIDLREAIDGDLLKTLDEKLNIMDSTLAALDYAHAKGVVHRDIKPANIHLGKSRVVKIMDFGLARISTSEMTQEGIVLGTPNYMSPEQALGDKVDGRSDIFSTGAVLYELLTGHKPFEADTTPSVLFQVVHKQPPPVRRWTPDMPGAVVAVVNRALEKDLERRFASAGDMRAALAIAREGLTPARQAPSAAARPAAGATAAHAPGSPAAAAERRSRREAAGAAAAARPAAGRERACGRQGERRGPARRAADEPPTAAVRGRRGRPRACDRRDGTLAARAAGARGRDLRRDGRRPHAGAGAQAAAAGPGRARRQELPVRDHGGRGRPQARAGPSRRADGHQSRAGQARRARPLGGGGATARRGRRHRGRLARAVARARARPAAPGGGRARLGAQQHLPGAGGDRAERPARSARVGGEGRGGAGSPARRRRGGAAGRRADDPRRVRRGDAHVPRDARHARSGQPLGGAAASDARPAAGRDRGRERPRARGTHAAAEPRLQLRRHVRERVRPGWPGRLRRRPGSRAAPRSSAAGWSSRCCLPPCAPASRSSCASTCATRGRSR